MADFESKRIALKIIMDFEGGSWGAVAGSFDAENNFSFGALQWNMFSGTLRPLLESYPPQVITDSMGKLGEDLLGALSIHGLSGLVDTSILGFRTAMDGTVMRPVRDEWRVAFAALGEAPESKDIQSEYAQKTLLQNVNDYMYKMSWNRLRSYVMVADRFNNQGAGLAFAEVPALAKDLPEELHVASIGAFWANKASKRWRYNSLRRVYTIMTDVGWVNGRFFDLRSYTLDRWA